MTCEPLTLTQLLPPVITGLLPESKAPMKMGVPDAPLSEMLRDPLKVWPRRKSS